MTLARRPTSALLNGHDKRPKRGPAGIVTPAAPRVPPGKWTPEAVAAFNATPLKRDGKNGTPPARAPAKPPTFEVVRVHAETGRVQLHAWDHATEIEALADADSMNREAARNGGRTLATSGRLETGWIYSTRPQGGRGR